MLRDALNGTVIYQSALLSGFPGVIHGVSTRHGGVSPAPFHSMNLSAHVGDDPDNVRENLERLHRALGLEPRATVDASQAQADRVAQVTERERGTRIQGVDGLITNVPGLPLMLRFADCVPILMYDPTHRAIGISHAGWRGTVARVLTNTGNAMSETFGTRPQDLIACIGPSIGPCCYEIGADVETRVKDAFPGTSSLLLRQNGSLHLDLWQANAIQLESLGVRHIEVGAVCTSDHTDDFFSWRRENARTGRFAALIALAA